MGHALPVTGCPQASPWADHSPAHACASPLDSAIPRPVLRRRHE